MANRFPHLKLYLFIFRTNSSYIRLKLDLQSHFSQKVIAGNDIMTATDGVMAVYEAIQGCVVTHHLFVGRHAAAGNV